MDWRRQLLQLRALGQEPGLALGQEPGLALGQEPGLALGLEPGLALGLQQGQGQGQVVLQTRRLPLRKFWVVAFKQFRPLPDRMNSYFC